MTSGEHARQGLVLPATPDPRPSAVSAAVGTGSVSPPDIRAALLRKALADARQRRALGRLLGLTDTEILAIQHLARAGELTPGQLASLLQLSSGGATGVIDRLERAGHVERRPHWRDRRSTAVSL